MIKIRRLIVLETRNPDGHRQPSREEMEQLTNMFPNIPLSVIRSELVRAGSVTRAIERLLVISPEYPSRLPQPRHETAETSPYRVTVCIRLHLTFLLEHPQRHCQVIE